MMDRYPRFLRPVLVRILENITLIHETQGVIMATLADLDTDIAAAKTAVDALVAKVTELEAAVAAGTDTSTQVAAVQAITAEAEAAVAPPAAPAV